MINHPKTLSQPRAKITQLKQEKEQLRILLHELIEAYYRAINQEENELEIADCCPCPKIKGENHE